MARATGRAEYQPVRVTRALKKGPRAASTGRADTSRRSETSSAEAAGRARSQRFRATSARRSESVIRGGAREESARRKSQTLGGARYERREGIRGRPIAAGRPDAEVAFSGNTIKEAERFGILQSGRFEHPYGGHCTAGTVQGHQAGRATRAALNLSTPT